MRRYPSCLVLIAWALAFPLTACAVPIDDFVLTGEGHVITYSLPATSAFPDFSLFNFFQESAPTTIDGVTQLRTGLYYDPYLYFGLSLVLSVSTTISTTNQLLLYGPNFIDFTSVPAVNPPPYFQYDIVATFLPGTYTLQRISSPFTPVNPPVSYTLTITQQAAATPEPSTLTLLGTGSIGLLAVVNRRRRR